MAMHSELWFPQVIWSAMLHNIDNRELKHWAYERKKNDVGRKVSNYGGYQSSDILPGDHEQIDKLVETLDKEIFNCCKQVGLKPLQIYNIWLNINSPGSYNHVHQHAGSVLSGIYYIDANVQQGNIFFQRNDNADYHLPIDVEKETYFTCSKANYASKTGGLYIFPSWLPHGVEGNQSKADRISLAFNYGEKQ
jgi:uncharacterized protein (TIGR02466 family)